MDDFDLDDFDGLSDEELVEFLKQHKEELFDEIETMQAKEVTRKLQNEMLGKKFVEGENFKKFQHLLGFLEAYLERDGGKILEKSTFEDCETTGFVEFECASLEFTREGMKAFARFVSDASHFDAYPTNGMLNVTIEIPNVFKRQ